VESAPSSALKLARDIIYSGKNLSHLTGFRHSKAPYCRKDTNKFKLAHQPKLTIDLVG